MALCHEWKQDDAVLAPCHEIDLEEEDEEEDKLSHFSLFFGVIG